MISPGLHLARIGGLMVLVGGLLAWLASTAAILDADGLRYIGQAQRIAAGSWRDGVVGAVDHPLYPLAIATMHQGLGMPGTPEGWQAAAQGVSVLAGTALVAPLYLVALELFGAGAAWLGVVAFFLVPTTGHVLADVMSEAVFLLWWTSGLYAALRFLRQGTFGWLIPTVACAALAYLTRPEGLLLPAALVGALLLLPLSRATRMNWPRWWAAVGLLLIGPALIVVPFALSKGGLTSKPAVARLLGTAPRSAADAVERARPLEPGDTELKLAVAAAKAVWEAIRDLVTLPLLPLAALGLILSLQRMAREGRLRASLMVSLILLAGPLALWRLHLTGGYSTPRHALLLGTILLPAAGAGLAGLLGGLSIPGWLLGQGASERFTAGPLVWGLALAGLLAWSLPAVLQPVNRDYVGYRQASAWLAEHAPAAEPVADVTGWSQFYGERPGYTFTNLREAPNHPELRYVVVREAHLKGRWWYCDLLRHLVGHRAPVQTFPPDARPGQARVYLFDRQAGEDPAVTWTPAPTSRR